jgi:hypothetical protein
VAFVFQDTVSVSLVIGYSDAALVALVVAPNAEVLHALQVALHGFSEGAHFVSL